MLINYNFFKNSHLNYILFINLIKYNIYFLQKWKIFLKFSFFIKKVLWLRNFEVNFKKQNITVNHCSLKTKYFFKKHKKNVVYLYINKLSNNANFLIKNQKKDVFFLFD